MFTAAKAAWKVNPGRCLVKAVVFTAAKAAWKSMRPVSRHSPRSCSPPQRRLGSTSRKNSPRLSIPVHRRKGGLEEDTDAGALVAAAVHRRKGGLEVPAAKIHLG